MLTLGRTLPSSTATTGTSLTSYLALIEPGNHYPITTLSLLTPGTTTAYGGAVFSLNNAGTPAIAELVANTVAPDSTEIKIRAGSAEGYNVDMEFYVLICGAETLLPVTSTKIFHMFLWSSADPGTMSESDRY